MITNTPLVSDKVVNSAAEEGAVQQVCFECMDFNLYYSGKQALDNINMQIPSKKVTAFIGPSGCGKSTLLRCMNRMNDLVDGVRIEGRMLLDGEDINQKSINVTELRRRVGMVFQKPNPFPKSVFENVAYGLRLQGLSNRRELQDRVEPFGHDTASQQPREVRRSGTQGFRAARIVA